MVFVGVVVAEIKHGAPRVWSWIYGAIVLGTTTGVETVRRHFPPPFDVYPALDTVTFEFRDLSLGYEFRALNPAVPTAGGLTSA